MKLIMKKTLLAGLAVLFLAAGVVGAYADEVSGVVLAKTEMPSDKGTFTRIFLDSTGDGKRDTYLDLSAGVSDMLIWELNEIIQVDDTLSWESTRTEIEGKYQRIVSIFALISHNADNFSVLFPNVNFSYARDKLKKE